MSEKQSMPGGNYLENNYRYDHVRHLMQRALLMMLHYDTEGIDLNRFFLTGSRSFPAWPQDIKGRILGGADIQIRVPRHIPPSAPALVVTGKFPDEIYNDSSRDPEHVAVARILHFFRYAHEMLWDSLKDHKQTLYRRAEGRVIPDDVKLPETGGSFWMSNQQGDSYEFAQAADGQLIPVQDLSGLSAE